MRKAGLTFAVAMVLAGVVLLREATRLPTGWTASGPGPGFFPFWLAAGFTVSTFAVLLREWTANQGKGERFLPEGAGKRIAVVFLPMAAVVGLLHYLGVYMGGLLYLLGYSRLVGRHSWPTVLAVSVGVPLTLFFVFERWFLMPMPKGIVLEWLLYGR